MKGRESSMNLVSQYVIKIGAYVLFAVLLEGILPQGNSKKIVKLMLSLLFLYVLIGPVISWLQQELPLEELTTVDFSWEEAEGKSEDYQDQAAAMVEQKWRSTLQHNLPGKLKDDYEILKVEINDQSKQMQVQLARRDEVGSLIDRSLQLGQIGVSREEEERIKNSLCESWGIAPENLEMKLR